MSSPYHEFVRKAKERFLEQQQKKILGKGGYCFTAHAQYKMKQYGLSEQRERSVIRSPKRREEGIVPKTVAVMQPVSMKKIDGKEVWKQEIWVMCQLRKSEAISNFKFQISNQAQNLKYQAIGMSKLKIISAWRYPGVSPK